MEDNAGAYRSSFYVQGSPEEAACLAGLLQRLGDEAADRCPRSGLAVGAIGALGG
jgi:hypothetical protein